MQLASYKTVNNPSATWQDKIIAILSFGRYSHTELVFSNGECFSMSPRDFVGRFRRINLKETSWDLQELDIARDEEIEIYRYCKTLEGIRYDWIGAAFSPLKICTFNFRERMFCSEACVEAIRLNTEKYKHLDKGCSYSPVRIHKYISRENVYDNK